MPPHDYLSAHPLQHVHTVHERKHGQDDALHTSCLGSSSSFHAAHCISTPHPLCAMARWTTACLSLVVTRTRSKRAPSHLDTLCGCVQANLLRAVCLPSFALWQACTVPDAKFGRPKRVDLGSQKRVDASAPQQKQKKMSCFLVLKIRNSILDVLYRGMLIFV